ncbi:MULTISPECIES: PRC-barrel domain-containing protein [Oxalobacteraceae]|uniref:PRC-barrel domain-containing protein n=1 Tax=Oxalobacteraceae TaxID=75682 RepID=UPI0010A3DCD3|nr:MULTISPECIES: PRC-barrel domain-containing protein [Oxalobacteraceae]
MQGTAGGRNRSNQRRARPARFTRILADESSTAGMLYGCPVVSAVGDRIGTVHHLMVDVLTHQLRYVVLAHGKNSATVAIPWQALYFDAALGRLVFYTLC